MSSDAQLVQCFVGLLVFFFGACWGSFFNVCIHRIPLELSVVKPRSHCPKCGKLIAWYDNIPILSYLVLRGKCRHCTVRISPRYFIVELLSAALFLGVWLQYGMNPDAPFSMIPITDVIYFVIPNFDPRIWIYWVMMGGLIVGTFIDLDHMILPDRVTIGGIILGLLVSPLLPELHETTSRMDGFLSALLGVTVGYGLLKLVAVLGAIAFKKDAMGMGDVKLMGGLGALLGWQAVLFIVMVSSLVGSVVGITLIATKNKKWQSRIPYGPYIAVAAIIWILGGFTFWDWYVGLLSGA